MSVQPRRLYTKEYLEEEYINKRRTILSIALENNTTDDTIRRWLKKYNIPRIKPKIHNIIDITNQRFGNLVVIKQVENIHPNDTAANWLCQCDCGKTKIITGISLRKNITQSCGCNQIKKMYRGYEDLSGSYWARLLKGVESRSLEINITIKDAWDLFIKQNKKCALTGLDIQLVRDLTKNRKNNTASLDRINSKKGYIHGNIQWVHKKVNILKNKLSQEELIYWSKLIAQHNQ